jgi:hypothetical protein
MGVRGKNARVPPSRSDRSLLLLAGSAIAIVAVLVGGFILLMTNGGSDVPKGLIFVGYEHSLRADLEKEGPQYIPNPFGDDGFWLDLENGKVVALVLQRPGRKDCNVRWRDSKHGYSDCNGEILQNDQLARYTVVRGPRKTPKNAVFVNIKKTTPAPNPAGS